MLLTLAFQEWKDFGSLIQYGPTVVLLGLVLLYKLKTMPAEKEVKLRELDLRSTEVNVRGEEAKALFMLSEVLRDVAVEQRKATEEQRKATESIDLLQRVNSDVSDRLSTGVAALNERLDREHENLISRVGALESNVQSKSPTA